MRDVRVYLFGRVAHELLCKDNSKMCMGGLISSSNEVTAECVKVSTLEPILWSVQLKPLA